MRVLLALIVFAAILLPACSPSGPSSIPERPSTVSTSAPRTGPQPSIASTDALVLAASKASDAKPIEIIGYEFVMWEKGRFDLEIFMSKDGRRLYPRGKWGAGSEFPRLDERPPSRLQPESDAEREAQQRAVATALAMSADKRWGADEAMVRIYLIQDAAGAQFLMSPDGKTIQPAPELAPEGAS